MTATLDAVGKRFDRAQVKHALGGGVLSDIGQPQLVIPVCGELAVNQVIGSVNLTSKLGQEADQILMRPRRNVFVRTAHPASGMPTGCSLRSLSKTRERRKPRWSRHAKDSSCSLCDKRTPRRG